jgi:hypothetical protein
LITLAAIALVLAVTGAATLVAVRADRSAAPAPTSPMSRPVNTTGPGGGSADLSIDFVTADGTGRLSVLNHRWREDEGNRGLLLLEVQVSCASGRVDFDPFNFQTFDESGNVYEVAAGMGDGPLLSVGTLRPGQAVRGQLPFLMPRGTVTLLMGDATHTVTALRIPD